MLKSGGRAFVGMFAKGLSDSEKGSWLIFRNGSEPMKLHQNGAVAFTYSSTTFRFFFHFYPFSLN